MLLDVQVVPATLAHAEELALSMRPDDAAEGIAQEGVSADEALRRSLDRSEESWTVLFDGEVAAIFGVASSDWPGQGVAWAVTGFAVDRHRKSFARISRTALELLLERYPRLVQMVDSRHAAALRWLRWLGFEVLSHEPWGAHQLPFHPVWIERSPPWGSSR